MDLSDLPQFTVDACRSAEDGFVLIGHLSHLQGVRIDTGWLYRADARPIVGTFSRVPDAAGEQVEFRSPDTELVVTLSPGETCAWVDGYWQAYHVAMILAGQWESCEFREEAAHYFRLGGVVGWQPLGDGLPEGAVDLGVRSGGWDHEHCELCRAHIGGPGDPNGYVDPNDHWLCSGCYERFAVPRDLAFAMET